MADEKRKWMTITSPFFHRPALLFIATTLAAALHAGAVKRLDGKKISSAQVDQVVTKLMREGRVTGLGLALFNNNEIVHGFGIFMSLIDTY